MAPPHHNLAAMAIVPPLGLGPSFMVPALAVCLACLFGLMALGMMSRGSLRNMAPAGFCLLALTVILWAMALWNVLS